MDAGLLANVADAVAAADPRLADFDLQHALRRRFDGMRIVVCNDDDVAPQATAAHVGERCRLYYLYAGEHCVRLSPDALGASGLLVGLLSGDGD